MVEEHSVSHCHQPQILCASVEDIVEQFASNISMVYLNCRTALNDFTCCDVLCCKCPPSSDSGRLNAYLSLLLSDPSEKSIAIAVPMLNQREVNGGSEINSFCHNGSVAGGPETGLPATGAGSQCVEVNVP